MLEAARAGETLPVHAYPSTDNPASNAVCRTAGVTLLGEEDFEVGGVLRTYDWVVELAHAPVPPLGDRGA
ncbi:hypothetical protein [Agromyces italicus]|uniref:hypothetical protein n=1 Tax=Agromyces italicus TaxID=279572 RepID=UPI0004275378|nr:hypothetical protein [Agromyces italicus]